jgi:hypothetical protein
MLSFSVTVPTDIVSRHTYIDLWSDSEQTRVTAPLRADPAQIQTVCASINLRMAGSE